MGEQDDRQGDQHLVADLVVQRLLAWGVRRVFGHSGDGINTVLGALRRAGDDVEFVQARHEENAALMAVGHAKYTGGVGVVLSTQGPGAVHLLNGLYDAKLDHVPVVAIVGQQKLRRDIHPGAGGTRAKPRRAFEGKDHAITCRGISSRSRATCPRSTASVSGSSG